MSMLMLVSSGSTMTMDPQQLHALVNAGLTAHKAGQYDQALASFDEILTIDPGQHSAQNWKGITFAVQGKFDQALVAFEAAQVADPENPGYMGNIGGVLVAMNRHEDACPWLLKSIERRPMEPSAHENFALAMFRMGQIAPAIKAYEAALKLNPLSTKALQNMIFLLDYLPDVTLAQALDVRRRYHYVHGAPLVMDHQPHTNQRDPDRQLRVGYVSGDFCMHSAAFCFCPVLFGHDRAGSPIKTFLYSSTPPGNDMVRDAIAKRTGLIMRDLGTADDLAMIAKIREDEIDILVDLAGYSRLNRVGVFLRRPAPIQATGWGHAQGMGLDTMDYLFADEWTIPASHAPYYREQIVRLPCIIAYGAPEYAHELPSCPQTMNGYITFGSLNRMLKLNSAVLDMWAGVLARVPESRLLIKDRDFDRSQNREWVTEGLVKRGVESYRIAFEGQTTHVEHLLAYGRVDIVLDTWPHGGGLTGMEGAFMGCPPVTLVGEKVPSRLGLSLLQCLERSATNPGIPFVEWFAADTPEAYIDKAVAWAERKEDQVRVRQQMRAIMVKAAPMQHGEYVNAVEAAYRMMWRTWGQS